MKASIVDLRYKMKDVIKALDRNEKITVLYHGKVKGVLVPVERAGKIKISSHPFFGMNSREEKKTVTEELDNLRKVRYDDI